MAAVSMWRACARLGRVSAFVYNRVALISSASVQLLPRGRYGQEQWFRNYSLRGLRRTPVKVIMPDGSEVDNIGRKQQKSRPKRPETIVNSIEDADSSEMDNKGRKLQKSRPKRPETIYNSIEGADSSGDDKVLPHYMKLGENTKLFTSVLQLTRNRKARERESKILLEGHRLIQDAIDAGVKLHSIFFSLEETLAKLRLPSSSTPVKLYKVMYKDMRLWSNLTTCPGIMGVFQQPNYDTMYMPHKSSLPVTILCDNVRDPTNLGSIIRCAAAAGCDKVILTKGCVDVWDSKVLRAASGAHFHIRLDSNIPWELVINHLTTDSAVYLATPGAMLLNESDPKFEQDDDSSSTDFEETGADLIKNPPKCYEVTQDGQVLDPSFIDEMVVSRYRRLPLKRIPYTACNYSAQSHLTMVIGGETEGLSDAAYKLAHDRDGSCISIPLGNGVESLNSAVAAGVILFEVQRQLSTTQSLSKDKTNKNLA